jgi:predicted anti-sigma-YlaC factor YlaD
MQIKGEPMRDPHITPLLEETPFSRLRADELAVIESHITACDDCRRALVAARLAETLIEARAAEEHEVSPFFKTRVMAAIRERRLSPEPAAWLRLWRAAGAMLSAMLALLVILVGLTVFNDSTDAPTAGEAMTVQNIYSPDEVVLGQENVTEETYDQVLGTLYDSEDGDGN